MKRWTFLMAAFLLGALPSAAWAQAAVGYGMAASKSTAIGAKMGPLIDSRGKQLATKIQDRMGTVRTGTTATAKPLPVIMEENRKKLEKESAQSGGSIHIESVPDKAAVAVDGEPVAYTPADLKVPEGKHKIELTHPEYLPWDTEITVNKIESTSVKAELEEKYKSSITLPKF